MAKVNLHKMRRDPVFLLEGSAGSSGVLTYVLTSTKRKEMKEKIRSSLWNWMKNNYFDSIRDQLVDVAIVYHTDTLRAKRQDVDNVAKVVLDAIKRDSKNNELPFLINDDSQVVRLLVQKLGKTKMDGYETDQVSISFRVHDPARQMILVNLNEIGIRS